MKPTTKKKPIDAIDELLARRRARSNIADFTTYTMPAYVMKPFHRIWCNYLDRWIDGDITHLMVFAPPGHGKSELVSRRAPAYILGKNPTKRIIATSYGADLAKRMNRDVQRIIDGRRFKNLFPKVGLNDKNVRTGSAAGNWLRNQDEFEVVEHGGYYKCAGVGGGITGRRGDYLIIDDAIKSAKEANSPVFRDNLWEWFNMVFMSRIADAETSRVLLTFTRWHDDDVAGRLLKLQKTDDSAIKWTVVILPALAFDRGDPLRMVEDEREPGEPLWPERFGLKYLQGQLASMLSYAFGAVYQQTPRLKEGSMFKDSYFTKRVKRAPIHAKRIRYWDRAATEGGGARTCGVRMSMLPNGIVFVEHVKKGQWGPHERDKTILAIAQSDRETFKDAEPRIFLEQEGGSSGKDQVLAQASLLRGFPVRADKPTGSKEVRADSFAAQGEAGNVYIVDDGTWNVSEYVEELCLFPQGKFADQVDASSGAYNLLAQSGPPRVDRELICSGGEVTPYDANGNPLDVHSDKIEFMGHDVDFSDPNWWE